MARVFLYSGKIYGVAIEDGMLVDECYRKKLNKNGLFAEYKEIVVNELENLISFLNKLDELKIYYRLNKIRDSILVEVPIPGQRWEIEFMPDGSMEIEKFITEGVIHDGTEVDKLFTEL